MTWAEWKLSARLAWHDRFIRWTICGTSLIVLITTIWFLRRILPEGIRSGVLIMHYTIYFGIDDVRPWQWVFVYPASMLSILVINGISAVSLYRGHPLTARVLCGVTIAVGLVWSIGSFFLLLINL